MSTIKANTVQIGQSATAAQNFTLYQPTVPDGTVRLGNGNAGAATDRITIDGAGNVTPGVTNTQTLGAVGDVWSNVHATTFTGAHGNISSTQLTTSTTSANQVIDSFSTSAYRTVKYLVQATSGTSYQSSEIMIVHDGTTAFISEYGLIITNTLLATFDVDVSGGNVRLLVTPTNAVTIINAVRTLIIV